MPSEPALGSAAGGRWLRVTNGFRFFYFTLFSYSTVREAKVNSFKIALVFRILQFSIIGYVVGWDIIRNKGYQAFDTVSSAVTTKVKGLAYVQNSTTRQTIKALSNDKLVFNTGKEYRLFDVGDYVIPPIEYNSIFILTNFMETVQTQGTCDEDYKKVNSICKTDLDCAQKRSEINNWNGLPSGRCINSTLDPRVNVCEVISWCPIEGVYHTAFKSSSNVIQNVENFTVFIKNDVQFKLFNRKQRNLLTSVTNEFISTCKYDAIKNPYCPVFLVGDILRMAEPDPKERRQMFIKGGVIQVEIVWNCNYDLYWIPCIPNYYFNRFDLKFSETSAASGFNFRFSDKFEVNGTTYRTLVKAFGIRFIIQVSGKAGKFNFIPFFTTVGSGIGLLSVATLVADCMLLNLTKKRKFYQQLKAPETAAVSYSSHQANGPTGVSRTPGENENFVVCYRF